MWYIDISVCGKYKFSVSSRVFDVQLKTCVCLLSIIMVAGFYVFYCIFVVLQDVHPSGVCYIYLCFKLFICAPTLCVLQYEQVMIIACSTYVIIVGYLCIYITIHFEIVYNYFGVQTVSCSTTNNATTSVTLNITMFVIIWEQ